MKIHLKDFRLGKSKKVDLKQWPTNIKPLYDSKEDYLKDLNQDVEELSSLQRLLFADNRYSVLLVFQAMDAAGKDGAIKHVMSGVNPQGCQVFSFKAPSSEDLAHDFLWRTNRCLPERGKIGIFNRSYYEEVLIVKVHPEVLDKEGLPEECVKRKDFWEGRYRSIKDMEDHLYRNGTRVIKFFLHLSKEEQKKRFLDRVEDAKKNWKLSQADIAERDRWKDYRQAYEDCFSVTSTERAPWYIVPADDKKNARLIISKILQENLKSLPLKYPRSDKDRQKELKLVRERLEKQG